MRVSTDPTDPAYIDDRPRKAWCNDVLIEHWVVADEFRRCIITADGLVHNGAVGVERLSANEVDPPAPVVAHAPSGFSGMFEPVKPEPPVVAAPSVKQKAHKRRR